MSGMAYIRVAVLAATVGSKHTTASALPRFLLRFKLLHIAVLRRPICGGYLQQARFSVMFCQSCFGITDPESILDTS